MLLDRLRGLDFLTILQPEDVGLDPSNAFRSSPSGNKFLVKVLNVLNISNKDSIIDIGCGKGSAMRTMLRFPFFRVDGVELSESIGNIATQNFRRLNDSRSKVFVCDAVSYMDYDLYNIVYLYNPFPSKIMSEIIGSLINSIDRVNREIVIIYNNPTAHEEIVRQGIFSLIAVYPDEWGNGIAVYSNRPNSSSRLYPKTMKRIVSWM